MSDMTRELAQALLEEIRQQNTRDTEVVATLRGLSLNNVIKSELVILGSQGRHHINASAPYASVGAWALDSAVTLAAGPNQGGDVPTQGIGVIPVTTGSAIVWPLAGGELMVYGTPGARVLVTLWSAPQSPNVGGVAGGPDVPLLKDSKYYIVGSGGGTLQVPVQNTVYYMREIVPAGLLDYVAISVTTGQAGTTGRLGVYADTAGAPAAKLWESAVPLATDTNGLKNDAPGLVLAGVTTLWFAMVTQGGGVQPTLAHASSGSGIPEFPRTGVTLGELSVSMSANIGMRSEAGVAGGLPPIATPVFNGGNVPRIAWHIA